MAEFNYDAIVIGGGHNGLITAAYLARAGLRPLVLEARPILGGAAVTEEIYPGFRVDSVLHSASMLRPQIIRDLFLKMYDFEFAAADPLLFLPLPGGESLTLWSDPARSEAAIRALAPHDADRFADFCRQVERYAGFIESALARLPSSPSQVNAGDVLSGLLVGGDFRRLGDEMYGLLRVLPMSLIEWMDEWFTTPAVRAAVGAPGVIGLRQGPRSGGTALLLLYHHMGQRSAAGAPAPGIVRGGIGKLTQALADSARNFGAEIRTSARVEQVILENGRATGVALTDGDEIRARIVISSANPRHTFTELVDMYELPPTFNRAVENIRFRGVAAKVNLALNNLPRFRGAPADDPAWLRGRIQIGSSLTYIEQAYDAAKYGRFSDRPFLDITIPTLHDPSLAPAGKHTMSILVQYAPYALREGSWEECRDAFGETVINILAEYAPDIRETIIHRQVLTPVDLETTYGLAEGNLYHGEMMLDQLLYMRPVPGWSGYRTPIPGLYLCGAGCHPGGGITGEPGRLAAQVILQDAGKNRPAGDKPTTPA